MEPIDLAPNSPLRDTLDGRFWLVSAAAAAGAFMLIGLPSDLLPNPLFGRQVAADPFAYLMWLASAPLAGLVAATYLVRWPPSAGSAPSWRWAAPCATRSPSSSWAGAAR